MAFRAFLVKVKYIQEVNQVTLWVEHRNDSSGEIESRTYSFVLPVTVNAAKTTILNANQVLNQATPAIIDTLNSIVGTEIT